MMTSRVLVIEDDARYRDLLRLNLVRRGYKVLIAEDGLAGLNLLERDGADLVILDLMLPDIDGLEVCERIRTYSPIPIMMLTAKSEESHKVSGLRHGADDYVTKPFGAEELLARVEALLRRSQLTPTKAPAVFVSGDLKIDFARRRVKRRDAELTLSRTEYELLACLARNAGYVLVHGELLRRVWGPAYTNDIELLHTAVHRLRCKIEVDAGEPRYVISKRGIGYCLSKTLPSP